MRLPSESLDCGHHAKQNGLSHFVRSTFAAALLQVVPPPEGERGDPRGLCPHDPVQLHVHPAPSRAVSWHYAHTPSHGRLLHLLHAVVAARGPAGHRYPGAGERQPRQELDQHVAGAGDSSVRAGVGVPVHRTRLLREEEASATRQPRAKSRSRTVLHPVRVTLQAWVHAPATRPTAV